jgi:hypothetical protein
MAEEHSYDISIDQGSTFSLSFTVKNDDGTIFNLTGYTGRGQIRRLVQTISTVAIFAVTPTATPTDGKLIVTLVPAQTAVLEDRPYVYDVEVYKGAPGSETDVKRLLSGNVTVNPSATQSWL